MLGSNQKERAVLLCNYFLHHNQEAWIVVGSGIPEGKLHLFTSLTHVYTNVQTYTSYIHLMIYAGDTYYVLTKSLTSGTYWLWNPSTGEYYDQHDTNCTLISIGCIFNARNVSCNDGAYELIQLCMTRFGQIYKIMKNPLGCIWMLVLVVSGKHYSLTRSLLLFPLINRPFSTIILQIPPSLPSCKTGTTCKQT